MKMFMLGFMTFCAGSILTFVVCMIITIDGFKKEFNRGFSAGLKRKLVDDGVLSEEYYEECYGNV